MNFKGVPLRPWIIAECNGIVRAGHCNCIVGLGETCGHVGAMLFAIEAAVKIRNSASVTDEPPYWLMPKGVQKIEFSRVQDINFESAETLKRKMDQSITVSPFPRIKSSSKSKNIEISPPTDQEIIKFYKELHESNSRSAVLSLIPEYCRFYGPCHLNSSFPKLLYDIYDESCTKMSTDQLFDHCNLFMQSFEVTSEQAAAVEKETRLRERSKQWLIFRTGLIADSKLKAVCEQSVEQPSIHLLKSICYPKKGKSKQNLWDCYHLKEAYGLYNKTMNSQHQNFNVRKSGLIINPSWPYLAAFPDHIVSCKCCGEGTLELKCLCCNEPDKLSDASGGTSCFNTENQKVLLKHDHTIYYQIQAQLNISSKGYGDVVIVTSEFTHVERNKPDANFWADIIGKAANYFRYAVLPEVTARYYTRSSCIPNTKDDNIDDELTAEEMFDQFC